MKILHTSNILLGKSFEGCGLVGDKLRVGIKQTFSKMIDLAIAEPADILILAGDTFDSLDVSQKTLDFFLTEIKRLGTIPVVILPGARDFYRKGSFWDEWRVTRPSENLFLLTDIEKPFVELSELSTFVYGYPALATTSTDNLLSKLKRSDADGHHIAVVYGDIVRPDPTVQWNYPLGIEDLFAAQFDYVALGGQMACRDYSDIALRAAYPGSLESLGYEEIESGNALLIDLKNDAPKIEPRKIGSFAWKEAIIQMETVVNFDDLKQRIREMGGPDVLLKVSLKGLTLFESGLDLTQLHHDLEGYFLNLEFIDSTNVLPENVSAVKVQEKTMLGQYLKLMVDKMNGADEAARNDYYESLKIGYRLLAGKEI